MRRLLSSLLIILLSTCSLTHSLDEGNSDSMFFRQVKNVVFAYYIIIVDTDSISSLVEMHDALW
jgi:hypothetical protein